MSILPSGPAQPPAALRLRAEHEHAGVHATIDLTLDRDRDAAAGQLTGFGEITEKTAVPLAPELPPIPVTRKYTIAALHGALAPDGIRLAGQLTGDDEHPADGPFEAHIRLTPGQHQARGDFRYLDTTLSGISVRVDSSTAA